MMEFIASSRGNKQLLVLDGYVHSEHRRVANNVISWEYINRGNIYFLFVYAFLSRDDNNPRRVN